MMHGLIQRAMTRPTIRDTTGAREAGQAWADRRLDKGLDAASFSQPQSSEAEQQRRARMGNWVQTGEAEGQREHGGWNATQPPRPERMSITDELRDRLIQRMQQQRLAGPRQPAGFGAGGYFAGNSGNLSHSLAASNANARIGSLYSAEQAASSLAAHGMNLHPGRRR